MATYILVLQRDAANDPWLARASGNDPNNLAPGCTYNSGANQQFPKKSGDKPVNGACKTLTDQFGNTSPVITIKLA
jgi:hypothetical protein